MDILQKAYVVIELREKGIDVLIEELDQLKEELMPFVKGIVQKKLEGEIPQKEKEYVEAMKEYFKI